MLSKYGSNLRHIMGKELYENLRDITNRNLFVIPQEGFKDVYIANDRQDVSADIRQISVNKVIEKILDNAISRVLELTEGKRYLIYSNEHNSWWMPDRRGYTMDVNRAGRYGFEEAIAICNQANYGWNMDNRDLPNELPVLEEIAIRLHNKQIRKDK
jgi:hypothetical protein